MNRFVRLSSVRLVSSCSASAPFSSAASSSSSSSGSSPFQIRGSFIDGGNVPEIGRYAEFNHTFSQADVNVFAGLIGDDNPIHVSPEYAEQTIFKGTIVHGILVSSLFSTLFGRSIPGAVYVSQSVRFKRPVHVGARVVARMQIVGMEQRRKGVLLTCATTCSLVDKGDEAALTLAVEGSAEVLLIPPPTTSS